MLYDVVIKYAEHNSAYMKLYNRRVDFLDNVKEAGKWAFRQETECLLAHPTAVVYVSIESVKP